jgi:hypothetical protein
MRTGQADTINVERMEAEIMTRRAHHPMLAAGAAAAVMLMLTSVAPAQPGPGGPGSYGWGHGMMMGPGMMGPGGFGFMCNPRAAGLAEWRMERIEDAVRPTDAQRTALDELRKASEKAAETMAAACPAAVPAKSTERLEMTEKRLEATLQAVKTVRPAFDAFYALLSDEQKGRLDKIGPRRWGWNHWRWSW